MLEVSEILNASVLIVDDLETNVMLLEKMLRNVGYTNITTTMDPQVVCAMHAEHNYDLILLDLQMPEMDGFEVMEALKKLDTDSYLPVLVITAQPGHKLRALQAGAKDFVSKPFDMVEVQTRIHNMLEVRLLYRKLDNYNKVLEQTVLERTAELRESEARFKSLTELSSDWYWEQDLEGNFTKVSGPVFEMLGIEADDMLGDSPSALAGWNPAERAQLDANIAARRPFLDFVYSRTKANGAVQFLQVSGEPMFDSASRFIGYRGIGMDVTDRMNPTQAQQGAAQVAPQETQNRDQQLFRNAVDTIDQGVCVFDRATMRMIDVNEAVCRLSGYSKQELFTLDSADFGMGSSTTLANSFDGLIAGEPKLTQVAQLRRKDGTTLDAMIHWRALKGPGKEEEEGGVVVGLLSAIGAAA